MPDNAMMCFHAFFEVNHYLDRFSLASMIDLICMHSFFSVNWF